MNKRKRIFGPWHEKSDEARLVLPCSCGCELVMIAEWDEDICVEFYKSMVNPPLKWRLRLIWRLLRNREVYPDCVVWDRVQMEALRDWLVENTSDTPADDKSALEKRSA